MLKVEGGRVEFGSSKTENASARRAYRSVTVCWEGRNVSEMTEGWTLKDQREYSWEYFKVHAEQRVSLFHFFVVFSSLVTVGLAGTLQKGIQTYLVGVGLGAILMLVSFVFWKLNKRVGYLIKHAESALKWIEAKVPLENCKEEAHVLQLFILEEIRTKRERKAPWHAPWKWHLTYSKCFGLAFLAFGLIGLAGTVVSLVLWI